MDVCVIESGPDFPWGKCKCEDFPPHSHLSKGEARKAFRRGELHFRANGIYQRVQNEKTNWKVKRGDLPGVKIPGVGGFVGVQMV